MPSPYYEPPSASSDPESLLLLADAARARGDLASCLDFLRRASSSAADASSLFRIAVSFHLLARLPDAIALYRRTLALDPAHPPEGLHNNLGVALHRAGRAAEAIPHLRQAAPTPDALSNLASALKDLGRLDEAIATFNRALALAPGAAAIHSNLAATLAESGDIPASIAAYDRALALDPSNPAAASNRLYTLLFLPGRTPAQTLADHQLWARRFAPPVPPPPAPRGPRFRVGYSSPNFSRHAVGRLLLPLLRHHDHAAFEIFLYSDVAAPDAATELILSLADHTRDTRGLSDAQLADLIRADRIDILVDLTMHMAGNRLLTFARRPAPVQISYLAYCGTTGLPGFRLSDPHLDPPEADTHSTETTLRLPTTYWCYEAPHAPEVSPPPSARSGRITFGSFNNFMKVSPPALDTWLELLRMLPDSRLILHAHEPSRRALAAARSIDPARIEFRPFAPLPQYLAAHAEIDIALDPFPYAGGTTTLDALYMGVPVVTLAGASPVERAGLSILANAGVPDLITHSPADYLRTAAALARDPARLAHLRATLRPRLIASPLMNAPQFARDVESAYRQALRLTASSPP